MFEGLMNTTALDTGTVSIESFEDLAFEALENLHCDETALHLLESLQKTYDDLTAFMNAVKEFGATRSLMAFADHDKILSTCIPEIPGLEQFNTDSAMVLSDAALEGILHAIKDTASRFWEAIKDHVVRWRRFWSTYYKIGLAYSVVVGTLQVVGMAMIAPAMVIPAFLVVSIGVYLNYKTLQWITNVKSTPAALKTILSLKLPDSDESYKAWMVKVAAELKEKAGIDLDKIDDAMVESSKETIGEQKVSAEQLKKVIEESKTAFASLKGMDAIVAGGLEKLAKTQEAETKEGRRALTYLATVVTKVSKVVIHNTTAAQKVSKKVLEAAKTHHKAA